MFYTEALQKTRGLDMETKKLATTLRDNESEHVDALTATIEDLGGKPVGAPGVNFGGAFASRRALLKTAQTIKDLGVGAYNGAAPMIKSAEVLGGRAG